MKMVEVKTAELIGPALDWAVAEAIGHKPRTGNCCAHAVEIIDWNSPGSLVNGRRFEPSTDWSQGGPLIEKLMRSGKWELVQWCGAVAFQNYNNECVPVDGESWDQESMIESGETPLIAACRAIVAAKRGDTVRVPASLVGGDA